MNIPHIQLPPQTPLPVVNSVCPNAPEKNLTLNWGHAIKPKVARKLVFDDDNPKNDFLVKNKKK